MLGPLVVGAFCWEGGDQAELRAAGADDSKAMSAAKREAALARLATMGTGEVLEISPSEIDAGNINALEEDAFVVHILRFAPARCAGLVRWVGPATGPGVAAVAPACPA